MAGRRPRGVLLALSDDDSDLVRALDAPGSGLVVVRRCADAAELAAAVMAGLAPLAVLDTRLDGVDRPLLERLARAGASGILLAPDGEEARWSVPGWAVLPDGAAPGAVADRLRAGAGARQAPPPPGTGTGAPAVGEAANPPGPPSAASWGVSSVVSPSAATPPAAVALDADETGSAAMWAELDSGGALGWGTAVVPPAAPGPVASGSPSAPASAAGPAPTALPSAPPPPPGEATAARAEGAAHGAASGHPSAAGQPGSGTQRRMPGRVIAVWGPLGAPGRSTLAAALAHALARDGGSLLVDADVEAPSLCQMLDLPEEGSGLATAARLASHGRLDTEAFARLVTPMAPGREVLTGLGRPGRWRELPAAAMPDVWAACRERAAWTVVDLAGGVPDDAIDGFTLEPGRGAVAADLLRSAELVLVVGLGDPVGVRRLLHALEALEEIGPVGRREVVVNRVRSSVAGPGAERAVREAMSRFGGVEEVTVLPDDPRTADSCALRGTSLLEGPSGSPLVREVAALAERLSPPAAGARRGRSSGRSRGRRRRAGAVSAAAGGR